MSDSKDHKADLPSARDVLASVSAKSEAFQASSKEKKYIYRFGKGSVAQQANYEHLKGIRDHYEHKGRWSNFLICTIAAMLAFQSYLLVMVGRGVWDFSAYEWLLPALLVQNLAQVVGLSVWAVKYLFSDISGQKIK
tara:strand:- start:409 stop:819 length:411 start_codon:yes stop_codon:yes gene_type:complete